MSVDFWFFTHFWLFLHVGNIELFCGSKNQNKSVPVFANLGKFLEINKQFHVKSWLRYRSYSSVWWILSCTNFIYVDLFVNDKFNDSNWKERNSWWKKGHLTPHTFMKTLWNSYLCANKNVAEPCKLLFLFLTCAYALTFDLFVTFTVYGKLKEKSYWRISKAKSFIEPPVCQNHLTMASLDTH